MPSSRASAGSATAAVNSRASTMPRAAKRSPISAAVRPSGITTSQVATLPDAMRSMISAGESAGESQYWPACSSPALPRRRAHHVVTRASRTSPRCSRRVGDRAQALAALHLEQHLGARVRARLEQHGDHGRDRDDCEQQRGERVARDPRRSRVPRARLLEVGAQDQRGRERIDLAASAVAGRGRAARLLAQRALREHRGQALVDERHRQRAGVAERRREPARGLGARCRRAHSDGAAARPPRPTTPRSRISSQSARMSAASPWRSSAPIGNAITAGRIGYRQADPALAEVESEHGAFHRIFILASVGRRHGAAVARSDFRLTFVDSAPRAAVPWPRRPVPPAEASSCSPRPSSSRVAIAERVLCLVSWVRPAEAACVVSPRSRWRPLPVRALRRSHRGRSAPWSGWACSR